MSDELKPGLYKHFKGGLYYALGVAYSHECPPNALKDGEVMYWSYEKKHWRRRPLHSDSALPDKDRVGWSDYIDREGVEKHTQRFTLVQPVEPHVAMRFPEPWIPVLPGEPVTVHALKTGEMLSSPCDKLLEACKDLDGKELTVSYVRAKLNQSAPNGCFVEVHDGRYLLTLKMRPDDWGVSFHQPLMRFVRGKNFPADPKE